MNRLLFGDPPEFIVPESGELNAAAGPHAGNGIRKQFSLLGKLLFPGVLQLGSSFANSVATSRSNAYQETNEAQTPEPPELSLTSKEKIPALKLGALPQIDLPIASGMHMYARELPTSKEFRRICSEVIPGELFVSGWLVAEDWELLGRFGITHVINTACSASKCPFPEKIVYLPLSIEDSKNEDIQAYFYVCFEFIEDAIRQGGKVLVHCMEGVSRSCTIAIAYLMWKRGMTYSDAQREVQKVRPICQPNAGFLCQLLEFQRRLEGGNDSWIVRVTARRFEGAYVVVGVSAEDHIDPRFSYVCRNGNEFKLRLGEDSLFPGTQERMAREVISRIWRIENIANKNIGGFFEFPPGVLIEEIESLNKDFDTCREYVSALRSPPSTHRSTDEVPFTSRSHKSNGSIESESDSRVFVLRSGRLEGPIRNFDSDDLDSREIYVFMHKCDATVVWIGNETEQNSVDVRSLVGPDMEIQTVQQGAEPHFFWDLFQQI